MHTSLHDGVLLQGEDMDVYIAKEKKHLEKKHTGVPDGGSSAEERKQVLAKNHLHLKQQKRTQENGAAKAQNDGFVWGYGL
jgi:hypothetical protein